MVWHTRGVLRANAAHVIAQVGDAGASRLVLVIVVVLVVIGIGLVVLAGWLWHATRVDPPALAVLEAMGERRFQRADAATQQAMIEATRGAAAVESAEGTPLPSDHG